MKLLKLLFLLFQESRTKPDFVHCPCDICDGMWSTRDYMYQGQLGWYCCAESLARAEPDYSRYRKNKVA